MPSHRRSNAAELRGRQGRQKQGGRRAAPKQQLPQRSAEANDIIGVILIAIAAAMAVALLMVTPAPLTQKVGEYLSLGFGKGALLVPLGLTLFALTFFANGQGPLSGHVAAGLSLMLLAILSLMSLTFPQAEWNPDLVLSKEVLLARGGYVGSTIAWGLLKTVGFGVGVVLLISIIIIGLVICGFSISGMVAHLKAKAQDAGASLQEARERHFEELRERKAERVEQKRERRALRTAQSATIAGQEMWDAAELRDESAPATSFIGSRKTTVLHRRKATLAPRTANDFDKETDSGNESFDEAERTSDAHAASAITRRLFRRKTSQAPNGEGQNDAELGDLNLGTQGSLRDQTQSGGTDVPSAVLKRSSAAGSAQTRSKKATIPEFLRAQARNQAALPFGEVEPEVGTGELEATPTSTSCTSHPSSKKKSLASVSQSKTGAVSASSAQTTAKLVHERPGDNTQDFNLPPFEMLSSNPHSAQSASSDAELSSTMRRLQSTLAEFGLTSKVVDYVAGPLVTTFQVEMGEGERVNKIVNLEDDIALTLAAESVRIFAPIPGTSRVGIEIPNKRRESVHIGDVLPYAKGGPLEFAVGRDSGGKPVIADLAKMPHLLVAGSTGSGKSVMINSLIMSILMRDTPKQVRLILVDPKRVEFSGYNGLPHLYVPVVTEPRQAASALQWAVSEMERRLKVFERAGARNISIYNEMCTTGKLSEMENPPEPMPFMVIIIDELSDLMMVAGKDVEASIVRIAQLARAAGIHLVLATQRPSADVVTGLIKSNIETRIALSVASSMDSRVILDQTGAERLLGNGDMLFKFRGHRTRRILGCFVADDEIEEVVAHWCDQGEPEYHEEILSQVAPGQPGNGASTGDDEDDPLVWQAAQLVVESQLGSTSGLQRRLKVGYARAGRIMDMLAAKGIVGPPDGSKPREVLLDEDGLEQLKAAEEKFREV